MALTEHPAEDAAIELQVLLVGSVLDGTGRFSPRTGGSDDWLAARRWKSRHRGAEDCPGYRLMSLNTP